MSEISLADGGSLYFEVHGQGPPLMLVSGLGGLGSFWEPHLDGLARHFTVVTHDHRGTGRSSHDAITYSIEQMASDVLTLMDALELERVHFIGHSTGGAIGQQLALDVSQRIDHLVLSSTWGGPDPYISALFELRADILRSSGAETYNRLGTLLTFPPDWVRDHGIPGPVRAAMKSPNPDIILSRIDALLAFDRQQDLPELRTPTLCICARDDVVIPAYCTEALARRMTGAQLHVHPDGGHFLPRSRPQLYRDRVLDFLLDH